MTPSPYHPSAARTIDVDEARRRVLAATAPLPMVRVPLAEALGLVLAVDIVAGAHVSAFPNAAMDGFAVRATDTQGATLHAPATLRVIAAAVACEQFARPAIRTMLGDRALEIPTIMARLEGCIENRGGRRQYVRVAVAGGADGYVARIAGRQGSGVLSTLARANGLMIVPETVSMVEPGAMLPVQMLDWDPG